MLKSSSYKNKLFIVVVDCYLFSNPRCKQITFQVIANFPYFCPEDRDIMAKHQNNKSRRKKNQPDKKPVNPFVYLAGILLLTVIVYAGAMSHDFIYQFDDDLYVTNNSDIQSFAWDNIKTVFTNSYVGLYLPLTMLTYMAEYAVFGLNPDPYHVINLIIHLVNTLLVFVLIRRLKPDVYIASVVAFVFALHPMHVESVTWISERKDVLYTLFYLGGLIAWLRYIDKPSPGRYLATMGLFVLSLFSKTIAVSFPLFLVAFDWYRGRKLFSKKVILEKVPFFALSLAIGLLGIYFTSTANDTSTPDIAWAFRPFIVSDAILIYLYKFIGPFNLMNYYYYPDISDGRLPSRFYLSTAILIFLIVAAIIWAVKTKSKNRDLLLGFIIFMIPTIFVLQIIPAGRAYAAERYTYISYIGLSYIFGILTTDILKDRAQKMIQIRATIIVIIAFFAIGFSWLTWDRNKDWKDSFTLFNDLVEKNPDHFHPYLIRGITHVQFGNREEALADYNKSLSLNPNSAKALANRSSVKGMLGDYEGALRDATRALEIRPGYDNALNNRATARIFLKDYEGALADIDALLGKDSTRIDYLNKKIMVLEKMDDKQGLLNTYLKLIRLEPGKYLHYGKAGEMCFRLDKNEDAIRYLTKSMEMNRQYYQPLMLRGNAYYKTGEYKKALADFSRFAQITNDPSAFYNAGMSHMMLGEMPLACESWQKALELGHHLAADRITEHCR